jgi:phosphoserine phosphatase
VRFAAAGGVDLRRSYFYTDSITDLPVLERVGEPRVVNPDLRLRRVAQRRGWPVLNLRLEETTTPGALAPEDPRRTAEA